MTNAALPNSTPTAPSCCSARAKGAKLTPATVTALLETVRDDVHQTQPAALSITNATEYGLVYTPDETAALGALAKARGLGFHVDGARFANAVVSTGASPADLTWRAGVDALSFGFVKNGGLSRRSPRSSSATATARRPCTAASAPGISSRRAAIWPRRFSP